MLSNNKTVEQLQNITAEDSQFVGKSICTLARFSSERLPIPSGFVISTMGFNQYLDLTDIRKYYEKSRNENNRLDIIDALDSNALPGQLQNEINSAYSKISGFTDTYVNLRAIILDNNSEEICHSTYAIYDVKGEKELINSIESLYRDILNENLKDIDAFFSGELNVVILIQKAIQSEASGIMFTTDIITKDKTKLVIEAVYGLESGTSKEGIIPDQYIFDKVSGEIREKHISNQEFMIVRQMGGTSATQKVVISPAWQKRQKLDDKHILVLSKTGQIIEEELNDPQQVNWSYESGKIWINFIESVNKKQLPSTSNAEGSLDKKVDDLISSKSKNEIQVNMPEKVLQKELLADIVLEEESNEDKTEPSSLSQEPVKPNEIKSTMNTEADQKFKKEPLLEGMHSAGGEAQGQITFNSDNANVNNILVLKGDEDISSTLKVSGFIIEDESEILAERLFEYFKVPVITGVALARKILKEEEKVTINGKNAHIYELVPFNKFVEEEIVVRKPPILKESFIEQKPTLVTSEVIVQEPKKEQEESTIPESQMSKIEEVKVGQPDTPVIIQEKIDEQNKDKTTLYEDQKIKVEKRNTMTQPTSTSSRSDLSQKRDISKLLDLVDEDKGTIRVEEKELSDKGVQGVSKNDQLKVWGKSLEKILSASKKVSPAIAANALEHVVEEVNEIEQNSKEFAFDSEERYIAQITQEKTAAIEHSPFVATATKVYVQLIDESLEKGLQNFDGIIFSSTQELDTLMEYLEDTLENSNSKEVVVICPPYEESALSKFFDGIYELRNKGYRNLSLILPDYRNKKEIAEVKKLLTISGLRRSSTFEIFANISRTINVFRISELEERITDGIYIDLFRLKMNMLGVEKLTASTKYVEGMKNLVSYVHENLKIDGKTLVNISAFECPKKVVQHLFNFGFWGIVCEQNLADEIKKHVSKIEQGRILKTNEESKVRKIRKF